MNPDSSKVRSRPDIGLLIAAADDWSSRRMARHQLVARLTRRFHVVWMNPAHGWRESLSGKGNAGASFAAGPGDPIVHRAEFWLPRLFRPRALARFLFTTRLRRARRMLEAQGCSRFVLYLWTPLPEALQSGVPFDMTCYHLSDEYTFSEQDVPISPAERRLLEGVDQVFIHSRSLMKKKGALNPRTDWVPNGVDYDAFAGPVPEPDDLKNIPHPRIGYTGNLKTHLNWELISELVARHPSWSFVFVGASKNLERIGPYLEALAKCPNAYFLGPKSSTVLAAYPSHFDVCVMPYRVNDYTRYIYPLKLHEYLASGSPAVGSRIPALEEFQHVVELAESPEQWSSALERALDPEVRGDSRRSARQSVAREYDWNRLVERIVDRVIERFPAGGPS